MMSSVGMSMGSSGIRAVRTSDGQEFSVEWFPFAGPVPDAEDVAHAIRTIVDRPDAPHSLGVAFPDPDHSAKLKTALVEEYVSEVHIISEIAGTIEKLRTDPDFAYRTVAIYDLGASGLEMTIADVESGTIYAATRLRDFSGAHIDDTVRDHLLTLDILAVPRTSEEENSLLDFSREIKEALSTHQATQTSDGRFRLMDRRMFELQIIRSAERSAIALRDLAEMSEIPPEVVVTIGGGAHIPLIEEVLQRYLGIPVFAPPDPEFIAAQGAALYASRVDGTRPVAPATSRRSAKTMLTPLLRFGLPSIVALGFLSWILWPSPPPYHSVTKNPDTSVEDAVTVGTSASTTRATSSTSSPAADTPPPAPPPPTPPPALDGKVAGDSGGYSSGGYSSGGYSPRGYIAPAAPPPPPPPPPPAFNLPRIDVPQIQLPHIQLPPPPRLPFS